MSNTALQLKPICVNYSNTADDFYGDKKSVQIFSTLHELKFPDKWNDFKIMGISDCFVQWVIVVTFTCEQVPFKCLKSHIAIKIPL